jgi:hypothetical protein
MKYRYYRFKDLSLYLGYNTLYTNTMKKFDNEMLASEMYTWLKQHGAVHEEGLNVWQLPSEEIKSLFLLRWA